MPHEARTACALHEGGTGGHETANLTAGRPRAPGAALNAGTTAAPRTLRTWWEQHGGLFAFLSIVVAVLSLLVTLGVGVAQVLMDSGPATPQEHIAACDKTHGAPGKTQISGPSNEDPTASGPQVSVFTSCTWPQASGVADDGRYQIRVTTVLLPEAASHQQRVRLHARSSWALSDLPHPIQGVERRVRAPTRTSDVGPRSTGDVRGRRPELRTV